MDSITSPFGIDSISLDTLKDDFIVPTNPPLTDPLGPKLLQSNPEGSTPA